MSKHRHRDKSRSGNEFRRPQQQAPVNNFPFGINPQQLLGMLGGMDMSGLGNILSSMNSDGFDLNSMNQQMNNGFNFNNIMGAMNNMRNNFNPSHNGMSEEMPNMAGDNDINTEINNDDDEIVNVHKRHKNKKEHRNGVLSGENIETNNLNEEDFKDENLMMLQSLRNIVDSSKVEFIDKMIEVYMSGGFKDI